jgi:tRNA (guanine-N7-)-methyltransferase
MEKQEIRTFGRRHGKKLSIRQQTLIDELLPTLKPTTGHILEIGFGAGEHVRDLARSNPDKIIIGAEPFMNGVASLLSAITDEKTNRVLDEYNGIRIWADDVRDFLRQTDSKFEQIWVLHPDPWPKARHEKRRLLSADFLKTLSKNLSTDGEIIIGTDHWEYFDWILEQVRSTNLIATIPNMEIIQTRYQHKNKAGTTEPKYLVLRNS